MAMTATLFFFAADVAATTALLLVTLAYLISHWADFTARVFALAALSTMSYMVARMGYAFGPALHVNFGLAWPVIAALMNMGTGFWMILCHSLFQEAKRFPRWLLVAFALQLGLSIAANLRPVAAFTSLQGEFILGTLPLVMQVFFALCALYWIVRGWRADLVASRRLLRWVFLGLVGGLYLGINTAETLLMRSRPAARLPWDNAITLLLTATTLLLAVLSLRFDANILARAAGDAPQDPAKVPDDGRQEADLQRFYTVFRDEKRYLQPGLTVADLARLLGMPQYRLRALINHRLGYRNFNALLHEYRIADACDMLADPANNDLPILTIALTVGYQSIAPFNQAFRELKGMTPSSFRQQAR